MKTPAAESAHWMLDVECWMLDVFRLPLSLLALALSATSALAELALDPVLAMDGLWAMKQEDFQQAAAAQKLPFRWNSNTRESARAGADGMTLLGLPLVEFLVRFEGAKASQVTAVIYARGDAGEMTREAFDALLRKSIDTLSAHTKVKFTPRGKDATSAVKADGVFWKTDKTHYLLEYSFTKEVKTRDIPFRAEFIRLEISPQQKAAGLLTTASNSQRAKFTGAMHVKRDTTTGDVWIGDVPMVDQGQKGYCAVASAERVMRYYGTEVDANELAQIANTETSGGTSPQLMYEAVKKLSSRLKVRVRDLEKTEVRDFLKLQSDYNRAAKKAGATEIPDMGNMIDVGMMYRLMKGDVLRDVRTKNKGDLSRFQREVQTHIDAGVPLLWSVQLGMFPEPNVPQSGGGHMRLIIGYNTKTQEILFSDSWGAGHELKRKPADVAWTITTGLLTIEPL